MDEIDQNQISGTIASVLYSDPDSGYTVLSMQDTDGTELKVTGIFPYAYPGEMLTVYGYWTSHPNYGRQFVAEGSERSIPENKQQIYAFLSGGGVKGIGPVLASLIVNKFGDQSLQILEHHPEKLAQIRGISIQKAEKIAAEYKKTNGMKKLVLFLSGCAVSPLYALRMYKFFGEQSEDLLKENPYILTTNGIGASFQEADRLAELFGIDEKDSNRICAGLLYTIKYNERNGHCFIPREKLLTATAQQLDITVEDTTEVYTALVEQRRIIEQTIAGQNACYIPEMFLAEQEVADDLARMAKHTYKLETDLEKLIREAEKKQGIVYAEQQRLILKFAAENQLLAITGGPGTGKTTSIQAIIMLFEQLGLKTCLAAPTGRASKRMTELTGFEAVTLHRLLGAKYAEDSDEVIFTKNKNEKLTCDAIIIDECSMVDIYLMHALLDAIPSRARVVLVGDAAQLPAVGPGDVFSAILRSEVIANVRLTEIFRQKADSRIVCNAHKIDQGEHPDLSENTGDFFLLRRKTGLSSAETIVELCAKRLPERMGIPSTEIQVLSPTKKGDCGTVALNQMLQAKLNPPAPDKKEKQFGSVVFRMGDRVIQNRNDYDLLWTDERDGSTGLGIFNGDIGVIRLVDTDEQTVTVSFDGRITKYPFELLNELEHAWALTVHKSQGSEYRAAVLAVSDCSKRLLTRGVLYTAVTRAKDLLILVGNENAIHTMIDNVTQTRRYNALRIRIRISYGI